MSFFSRVKKACGSEMFFTSRTFDFARNNFLVHIDFYDSFADKKRLRKHEIYENNSTSRVLSVMQYLALKENAQQFVV